MGHYLVSGASGFFGGILKRRLLAEGHSVVNIDLEPDEDRHVALTSIQGDIRDGALLRQTFRVHKFDAVFHCAAQLAHGDLDEDLLWTSNVDGTRLLAESARDAGVKPFVFLSTNCLWAQDLGKPVCENCEPNPVELYGRSKHEAEKVLETMMGDLNVVIIRCPTIMDSGRLGLLAILYEFIDDGKTVWVVGEGDNRYQFIYADDLATACIQAAAYGGSDLFHIGSDGVKSMREVYEAVIAEASRMPGTKARLAKVRALPRALTLKLMEWAHKLKVSPLGPYHYKMIASNFMFDTSRIKQRLGWRPTLTNEQMLLRAFRYYSEHRTEIHARKNASAHRKPASMGVIRALKWVS